MAGLCAIVAIVACGDDFAAPGPVGGSTSAGDQGGGGAGGTAGGATGGGGGGGASACGGICQAPTPLCDESTQTCVACLGNGDCTDPTAARCEAGSCVACGGAGDCSHLTDLQVCDTGTCVECSLDDESACSAGPETCDLLAKTCTGAEAATVQNCRACTNDSQCVADHRCIAMDFDGSAHGYFCLRAAPPVNCLQPFVVPVNVASVSGVAATDYCGIEEDLATCEAVLALIQNWHCSTTDGMCSTDGLEPEQAVPGAICRAIPGGNRCTYACELAAQCPSGAPANTCGEGSHTPPGWCGG